jgi:hypothetical protein
VGGALPVQDRAPEAEVLMEAAGTFTYKHDYGWVQAALSDLPGFDIRVWRSVSAQFLRAFIHGPLLGRLWLRILFWLEERAPRLLGRLGQYPMILFVKPDMADRQAGRMT